MSNDLSPEIDLRGTVIPELYKAGYERAVAINPELATQYIRYTVIADPPADRAVESLSHLGTPEVNHLIRGALHLDTTVLAGAPRPLREFVERAASPPSWWDPDAGQLGYEAFHGNSDLFMAAFFVATVKNAATLISKAFYATGRVNSQFGPRRIRQNTRHFIEIMLPNALDSTADGWRLSVRIRLVHAQIRHLIRAEGDWDEAVFGTPLSSAHMGLASANFSASVFAMAEKMGARLDSGARESFMQIWRYSSWLSGTPEELLFEADADKKCELIRIAQLCEPPPGEESVVIARALFEALPGVAGRHAPGDVQKMVRNAHRIVRALVGHELSDQLCIPKLHTAGILALLRSRRWVQGVTHGVAPSVADVWRGASFAFLLDAAVLDDPSYRIPDRLRTEDATPW